MDSFNRLKDAIKRYLQVAYGFDMLGGVILGLAVISYFIAGNGIVMRLVRIALFAIFFYRFLSQDHEKRASENEQLKGLIDKVKSWFGNATNRVDNSATKAYVRCPECGKQFALPKGKGTLRATCPHCGTKSVHKV